MLRIGLPAAGLTAAQLTTNGPKRVHLGPWERAKPPSFLTPF
jgi:hypothetical protein